MHTISDDQSRTIRDQLLARGAQIPQAQIDLALERLEAGTYAVCDNCGESIDAERIRATPAAAACRRCAPEA